MKAKVTYYEAVWIDKHGAFRVNGTIAKSKEETISKSKKHVSVKSGAKLHYVDSFEVFED